jgi:uncharacterized tellurite resistance protein B-like protein
MAESQILSVIRLWAAVAWADGMLAEAEAQGLRRLVATADLTADERLAAARMLDTEVALPDAFLEDLDEDARWGVYRAACKLAVVDRVLAPAERKLLDKIRDRLALDAATARVIEAGIDGFA